MKDIFISAVSTKLENWAAAFPEAQLVESVVDSVKAIKKGQQEAPVFWLHSQDQAASFTHDVTSILSAFAGAKVVILANIPNQADSLNALRAGAMGYCHAYTDAPVLREIRAVISHGGIWLGQDMLQKLIENSTKSVGNQASHVDELLAQLTNREQQVALEAAKGLSNKEIARVLNITDRTVKAHLAKAFSRLGARDRLHLALMLNKKSE